MLHDYMVFGTDTTRTEIANLDRFLTYGRLFTGSAWQGLRPRNQFFYPAMFGNAGPYTDPVTDNAPWIPPGGGVAEAEGFGGFMIERVQGGGGIPLSRQTFPGSSGGAMFGPGRIGPRVHNYRGWMVGAGELQLDYGFEWLSQTLMGQCLNPFERTSARWFAGRPDTRAGCAPITDLGAAGNDPIVWQRTAYGVQLTGAPEVVSRWATQGCFSMYEVAFQLTYANPFVYGSPAPVINNLDLTVNPVDVELSCCDETPGFAPPCFAEPFDPSELSGQNCWCQPDRVFRNAVTIAPINRRRFAPEVAIVSGPGGDTYNVRVAFYEKRPARGGDPADPAWDSFNQATVDFYECSRKLGVIEVPFIPAGATFLADGRTNEISITTAAGDVITRQIAQGEAGQPMHIPSSDGCHDLVVVIETDTAVPVVPNPPGTAAGTVANIVRHDQYMTSGGA